MFGIFLSKNERQIKVHADLVLKKIAVAADAVSKNDLTYLNAEEYTKDKDFQKNFAYGLRLVASYYIVKIVSEHMPEKDANIFGIQMNKFANSNNLYSSKAMALLIYEIQIPTRIVGLFDASSEWLWSRIFENKNPTKIQIMALSELLEALHPQVVKVLEGVTNLSFRNSTIPKI